jgi:hypothetical protein
LTVRTEQVASTGSILPPAAAIWSVRRTSVSKQQELEARLQNVLTV